MPYCTVQDVKNALDFPTVAPISDESIYEFILDAQDEIDNIYHTQFGSVEDSGTADGDFSATTFSDSTKTWTDDQFAELVVWIYSGTGAGQYRKISSNTPTLLEVYPAFDTIPDATSNYKITRLGFKDESVDGTGTNEMFVNYQPLVDLVALNSDGTDVTVSTVYQYKNSGRLHIQGNNCEITYFDNIHPQSVDIQYIFGVYPLPRLIKRLCVVIASIKTTIAQIAGTYDDFTSVSLPAGFTAAKGEPYMNIKASLDKFQQEAMDITNKYRPFTLFR